MWARSRAGSCGTTTRQCRGHDERRSRDSCPLDALDVMMGPPFFRVEHLSRRLGGLLAGNDATPELRRDQIVGLIGPNGAGQTTLLRRITRGLKPDAGRVAFNGADITPQPTRDLVN